MTDYRSFLCAPSAGMDIANYPHMKSERESSRSTTLDAIIIGAGASGLAAAKLLSERRKKFLVLEARPRVGGRVFTWRPENLSGFIELGAEFLHGDAVQTKTIARKANQPIYEVLDAHHFLKEHRLEPVKDLWNEMFDFLAALKVTRNDFPLQDFLRKKNQNGRARELTSSFVEGFDAAENSKISAKSIVQMREEMQNGDGAQMHRLTNGYDKIFDYFLQPEIKNKILLSTVVSKVQWKKHFVEVTAFRANRHKAYRAKKILITVPLGVLKTPSQANGHISFEPEIPRLKERLDRLEMGHVLKILFEFDQCFWLKENINFVHLQNEPFQVIWNFSPLQIPVLTVWSGGGAALKMGYFSKKEKIATALSCIAKSFNLSKKEIQQRLRGIYFHDWSKDPFSRGAYSYMGVDGTDVPKQMSKSIQNTIYFAGEAFSNGEPGTVEGALQSGLAAAKKML
jgi:monoamine oxidase